MTRPPSAPFRPQADRSGDDLELTLAALPDPWIVLQDCAICAAATDGPAAFILLHPRFGAAVVDGPAGTPERVVAPLRRVLAAPRFSQRHPGRLPVLALTIPVAEEARLAERLAEAFAALPPCTIADPGWCDSAASLLLEGDAAPPAPASAPARAAPSLPLRAPEDRLVLAAERRGPAVFPAAAPVPRRRGGIFTFAASLGALALLILCAAYALQQPSVLEKLGWLGLLHGSGSTPPTAANNPAVTLPNAEASAVPQSPLLPTTQTPPPANAPEAGGTPAAALLPMPRQEPLESSATAVTVPPPPPVVAAPASPPAPPIRPPPATLGTLAVPPPPPLPPRRPVRMATRTAPAPRAVAPQAPLPAQSTDLPPIDITDLPPLPPGPSAPVPLVPPGR